MIPLGWLIKNKMYVGEMALDACTLNPAALHPDGEISLRPQSTGALGAKVEKGRVLESIQ